MTSEEVDAIVCEFLAGIMPGLVNRVTLPQAIKAVDDLLDGLKGKLPDDARLELKARLLDFVFTSFRIEEQQQREAAETPYERLERLGKDCREHPGDEKKLDRFIQEAAAQGHVAKITDIHQVEETEQEWGQRMWEAIKAHLPESMYSDPQTEYNAWRIGFLIGYGGERLSAKILRWLWNLP